MKTIKFVMVAMMVGLFSSAFAQSARTAEKSSVFFVQLPHTQEQCLNALVDMKSKGDNLLSKFEFGCMSGEHAGFAFLEGNSEESIRQLLPTAEQKDAKIIKVDKFTASQIEKLHKEHM